MYVAYTASLGQIYVQSVVLRYLEGGQGRRHHKVDEVGVWLEVLVEIIVCSWRWRLIRYMYTVMYIPIHKTYNIHVCIQARHQMPELENCTVLHCIYMYNVSFSIAAAPI